MIAVGTDTPQLMRVSQKHLTMVSPIFEAMLGPKFAERQTVHNSTNPLKLLDDEIKGMTLMCKLAHHKIESTDGISAAELKSLVLL